MKKLKTILINIYHIKALKYVLVTIIAVALIGFLDENSVWSHLRNKQRISELQAEIKQYSDLHNSNQARIRQIEKDPKAMEKIARERYFMKADDEDIFVLSDDVRDTQIGMSDETIE
jgi:cell division protein FtsB